MRNGGDLTAKAIEWFGASLVIVAGLALSLLLVIDLSDYVGRYIALATAILLGILAMLFARHHAQD